MSLNKVSGYSYIISGGSFIIPSTSSNTLGNLIMTSSGNTGLGTASPAYTLDVTGTINASSFTGSNIRITGSITSANSIYNYGVITTSTISNLYNTNLISTNISTSTLNLTTGVTFGNANTTNLSITNMTIGNINLTSLTTASIYVSNSLSAISNTNTLGNLFVTGGNIGINNTMPISSLDIKNGNIRFGNAGVGWAQTHLGITNGTTYSSIYDDNNLNIFTDDNLYIDIGGSNGNGVITGATNALFIAANRNIGIGTTSPSGRVHVYESTGSSPSASSGSLIISRGNTGGSSSIVFQSVASFNDYGYIQYTDSVTATGNTGYNYFGTTSTQASALVIGCENDTTGSYGPDSVIITAAGNVAITPINNLTYISGSVGIGTTAPATALHVNGTISQGGYAPQDAGIYMVIAKLNSNTSVTANLGMIASSYSGASWSTWVGGSEYYGAWNTNTELYFHTIISSTAGQQWKIQVINSSAAAWTFSSDINWSRLMIYKIG